MYSRQQILHAIISDGQTMMNNGDVEDREAFQQKLHLLAAQWQSVARRANQRKAIIDSTIKQWQNFNDWSEKLRGWLSDKEEGLQVFSFDTASLQKVKNLVEKAKVGLVTIRPAKSLDLGRRLPAFSLHCRLSGFDVYFTSEIENLLAFFFQIEYFMIYSNQLSIRDCRYYISIYRTVSHRHRCQTD